MAKLKREPPRPLWAFRPPPDVEAYILKRLATWNGRTSLIVGLLRAGMVVEAGMAAELDASARRAGGR